MIHRIRRAAFMISPHICVVFGIACNFIEKLSALP
jgi:hypothetical protein